MRCGESQMSAGTVKIRVPPKAYWHRGAIEICDAERNVEAIGVKGKLLERTIRPRPRIGLMLKM